MTTNHVLESIVAIHNSSWEKIWEQAALALTELWGTGREEDKHLFKVEVTTK